MPMRYSIDLNNDFDTSDLTEDITEYVQQADWSLGCDRPYQLVANHGALTLRVVNDNGAFNMARSDSPFYGTASSSNLKIGARIAVEYIDPVTGGTSGMWRGLRLRRYRPRYVDHSPMVAQWG